MNKNVNRIVLAAVILVVLGAAFAGFLQSKSKYPSAPAPEISSQPSAPGGPGGGAPVMPPVGSGTDSTSATGQGAPGQSAAAEPVASLSEMPPAEYDQGVQPNDANPLPAEIAGLPRTSSVTGAPAIEQISKMHGTDIKIASGEIANYGKGEEKIIVWVSQNKTNEEAQALMRAMLKRMETPKTFTVPVPLGIKGRVYFQTYGQEMQHYFYLRGNRIYWVGMGVAQDKIMSALKFVVNGA